MTCPIQLGLHCCETTFHQPPLTSRAAFCVGSLRVLGVFVVQISGCVSSSVMSTDPPEDPPPGIYTMIAKYCNAPIIVTPTYPRHMP